ncbi:Nramp family divalent metal transporter [Ensifer adhaerens]|uniref:Nramp family divalent metal transporter n=1 Tax=Ensifer adhaerens TaxID=106592 RepID=UPI001C4DDF80|nr:Nramp family divalent metal transporter [Ensifer adhaerens]MBW0368361.1 Nramp family divalent metal transporter [Ensifer adhaerens]UCM24902.1 Nramp family divalent metal transporter [Ensifer adhaerens]
MDARVSTSTENWLRDRGEASLSDVHRSIPVRGNRSSWRRAAAFVGPGYLVAVGYMDPGNWATSLAGGSKFGYTLLVVALISNIMAIVLQSLCARLAIASGRDLAQACRDAFPRPVAYALWLLAEIAIIATDIAEVVGTAIGLNLIFGISLEIGVIITALDVFLVLYLQKLGFRWVEAFVIALLAVIATCFVAQIAMADPNWGEVIRGFAPTTEIVSNPEMLYLALGILGATVMPHNLYLHSGIVQTRDYGSTLPEKREALRFATIDSTVALMFALCVNASILILAAATFNVAGQTTVAELGDAHTLLAPMLGFAIAPVLFGIALLCCGINSTVTATLAGQIVMEGFLHIKLPAWLRRLITRGIAIVPAAVVTIWFGENGTAQLLILTQVVLSLQLSFAVFPLVMFTASKKKMGALVAPWWLVSIAVLIAVAIAVLNVKLLLDFVV